MHTENKVSPRALRVFAASETISKYEYTDAAGLRHALLRAVGQLYDIPTERMYELATELDEAGVPGIESVKPAGQVQHWFELLAILEDDPLVLLAEVQRRLALADTMTV
jgi:hypothetical protein